MRPFVHSATALLAACLLHSFAVASPQQASTTAPTAAVVQTTISGSPTLAQIPVPPTAGASTVEPSATNAPANPPAQSNPFGSGITFPQSNLFPTCNETTPRTGPFCNPANASEVFADTTYYITWDPAFFAPNSNITVLVNYANVSKTQLWSSTPVSNNVTFTTLTFSKDWLQGMMFANLTLIAMEYDETTEGRARAFDGPTVGLREPLVQHYPPPPMNRLPEKLGLMIGIPTALGFVLLIVLGLFFGMRHKRHIGIRNIMGRRGRGYKVGGKRSRANRLGMGQSGAIRLQERELTIEENLNQYTDYPDEQAKTNAHNREVSLGSLVSNEGDIERNAPRKERFAPTVFKMEDRKMKSWK